MAFGQQAGPPATARQVRELLELLNAAGHADFRDARGPMGFTQRQAGGKFTRDEAEAFIDQLQQEADAGIGAGGGSGDGGTPDGDGRDVAVPTSPSAKPPARNTKSSAARSAAPRPARAPIPKARPPESALSHVADADLAAELQRRGWIVVEP